MLTRHHVLKLIQNLILDYYINFNMRDSTGAQISAWHWLKKEIITGGTISVTLFSPDMNMIVKSAEVKCRGPLSMSGIRHRCIKGLFVPWLKRLLQAGTKITHLMDKDELQAS